MKKIITIFVSLLFITPCFSQQDLLPAYPNEISYNGDVAYFNGAAFTGILVDAKTNKQLGKFKNGYKNGEFIEYHNNGKKKSESNFTEGKLNGTYNEWFYNGQKRVSYSYYYGTIADGIYTLYLENGTVDKMETYRNGQRLSEDVNKEQVATKQNDEMSDKALKEMLSIVKMQAQQDSLMRIDLKKMQEQILKQNEQFSKTLAELSNPQNKVDTSYSEVLNKIRKNEEKQKEQIDSAVAAVKRMNATFQNSENEKHKTWKPKPIGIGVDIAGVLNKSVIYNTSSSNASPLNYYSYSPKIIFLSINPGAHFRIETEWAAEFSNVSGLKVSAFYYAVGLFGMWQSGKVNFYTGAKVMHTGFDVSYKNTDTTASTTYLTPTIGAEYAFANHFSIGSDIGLLISISNSDVSFGFNRFILRYYLGKRE